jgi:hypothetical protein
MNLEKPMLHDPISVLLLAIALVALGGCVVYFLMWYSWFK